MAINIRANIVLFLLKGKDKYSSFKWRGWAISEDGIDIANVADRKRAKSFYFRSITTAVEAQKTSML